MVANKREKAWKLEKTGSQTSRLHPRSVLGKRVIYGILPGKTPVVFPQFQFLLICGYY